MFLASLRQHLGRLLKGLATTAPPLIAVALLAPTLIGVLWGALLAFTLTGAATIAFRLAPKMPGNGTQAEKIAASIAALSYVGALTILWFAPNGRDVAVACLGFAFLGAIGQVTRHQLYFLAGSGFAAFCLWVAIQYGPAGPAVRIDLLLRVFVLATGIGIGLGIGQRLWRLEGRINRRSGSLNKASFRLVRASQRDPLTEAYNRRFLMDALEREKVRADKDGQVFSICLLDVDHFKAINDRYGHLAGDRVLREFAEHLRGMLRNADWVTPARTLGRYDGCEFMIILPATRMGDAREVAERLRSKTMARRFSYGLELTVSIGVAEYRLDHPLEELLKQADRALHLAKQMGRDRVESGLAEEPAPAKSGDVISLDAHRRR